MVDMVLVIDTMTILLFMLDTVLIIGTMTILLFMLDTVLFIGTMIGFPIKKGKLLLFAVSVDFQTDWPSV